ncbi:MAG: HAD family phosphatase [Clostridia bacterium]|nr:HAD family phosphatase [Clostridia bacterium]
MIPGIVFSDVDGTLLDSRHRVLPGTVYAIGALRARGIPFVIVSARGPSQLRPILREYRFSCPMICYSGALILDRDEKVLFSDGFSRQTALEIVRFIEGGGLDCTWNVYAMDTWIVKDRSDARVRREERIVGTPASEGSAYDLPCDAKVGKILCMCEPDGTLGVEQALKSAFPGMSIARSSDILVEIMKGGVTKRTGIEALCGLWGIPMERTLAFGDHYNDVEMLDAAGMPVLMGNAPKALRDRYARVTAGNDDEGIYRALADMGVIPRQS